MTKINPNNYDGATVTVVGRAGGEVKVKEFASGGSVAELSIAVSLGYKKDGEWVDTGTDWYTLSSAPDYAADNWPKVGQGDKVRVDEARLETREYERKDGTSGRALTLRYGTLSIVERKGERAGGTVDTGADFVPVETSGGF